MSICTTRSILSPARINRAIFATSLALAALAPASAVLAHGEDHRAKAEESITLTAPRQGNTLRIENTVGDVILVVDDNATELKAEIVKTGHGPTDEIAREILEAIEISFAPSGDNGILASAEVPKTATKGDNRGYSVDWRITAPSNFKIRARNHVGDVEITGFHAGVSLDVEVGDIGLADIDGGVTAQLEVGDFTATNIRGGIDAKCETGEIDIESDGNITCIANVGSVSVKILDGDAGDVIAKTEIGTVSLQVPDNRSGSLAAETDMGGVTVKMDQAGMTAVKKSSSRFSAQLAGASSPKISAGTEIGSVVITGYNPG